MLRSFVKWYKKTNKINLQKNYTTSYNLDIKFENVPLSKYLNNLKSEYNDLKRQGITNRRFEELHPIATVLEERNEIVNNISNLKDLLQDKDNDIKQLAEEEKCMYESKIKTIDENLTEILIFSNKDDDYDSIVLEVNAGVGGQEAMLFANELFQMYCNFVEHKGWNYQIAEYLKTDIGGIRHGSLLINGKASFKYFQHEAGVHRVQRIPATEKSGRVHTSTVSVLAIPQPTDIQINLNNKDLKFETKRASGAGGQHVNTTDSAVRVVHIPTGVAVECQVDRSQIRNREYALQRLKAKLYQIQLDKQLAETTATRKSQVKSNFRNEKIRTYNFSQDRITDHRLQNCNYHNLKVFFEGNEPLESLIDKLIKQMQKEELLQAVTEFENK